MVVEPDLTIDASSEMEDDDHHDETTKITASMAPTSRKKGKGNGGV
jgi:hypothetical protein